MVGKREPLCSPQPKAGLAFGATVSPASMSPFSCTLLILTSSQEMGAPRKLAPHAEPQYPALFPGTRLPSLLSTYAVFVSISRSIVSGVAFRELDSATSHLNQCRHPQCGGC